MENIHTHVTKKWIMHLKGINHFKIVIMKKIMLVLIACLGACNLHAQCGAIEVKVTGKGKPLVFLPDFGCPGSVWDETVEKLKDHYECHVITYAGFDSVAAIDIPWMKSNMYMA